MEKEGVVGDVVVVAAKKKTHNNTSVILPFVQGGLTGLLASAVPWSGISLLHKFARHEFSSKQIALFNFYNKRFPVLLLNACAQTTSHFGSFEILKQILEAVNHGRPLSLYQEASCGMAAGAIGSIFGCPLTLACHRIEANAYLMSVQQSYFRNLLLDLCHTTMDKGFLAMYRGGGPYTAWAIGHHTGMFASYGRSVSYFRESWGLDKSNSQLGAALVSGFFASACSVPCMNLANAIKSVRQNEKLQGKSFLDCTMKSFEIHGHTIFYKGFTTLLLRNIITVPAMWICFETIKDAFQKWP